MTGRAAERPFTESEAGMETGRTGTGGSSPPGWAPDFRSRRLASPASTASGPVALRDLMKGEAPKVTMTGGCACGARFRVDTRFPEQDMLRHYRTKRHLSWREQNDRVNK